MGWNIWILLRKAPCFVWLEWRSCEPSEIIAYSRSVRKKISLYYTILKGNYQPPHSSGIYLFSCCDVTTSNFPALCDWTTQYPCDKHL